MLPSRLYTDIYNIIRRCHRVRATEYFYAVHEGRNTKWEHRIDYKMVPGAGVEPARGCPRGILSPLRLPISPPGHCCKTMEAEAGIGPAYTALQAAA